MFGEVWCDVWGALDVLLCTSSIMNLCLISLDRYHSKPKVHFISPKYFLHLIFSIPIPNIELWILLKENVNMFWKNRSFIIIAQFKSLTLENVWVVRDVSVIPYFLIPIVFQILEHYPGNGLPHQQNQNKSYHLHNGCVGFQVWSFYQLLVVTYNTQEHSSLKRIVARV